MIVFLLSPGDWGDSAEAHPPWGIDLELQALLGHAQYPIAITGFVNNKLNRENKKHQTWHRL